MIGEPFLLRICFFGPDLTRHWNPQVKVIGSGPVGVSPALHWGPFLRSQGPRKGYTSEGPRVAALHYG